MSDVARIGREQLRIALPSKGRMNEPAERLLHRAGLAFRRRERRLYCSVRDVDAAVIFANADDIPTLVAEGVVELGISGLDLVREHGGAAVEVLFPLGFGRCKLALAVREASGITGPADLAGRTIGTSFPRAAQAYLDAQGIAARLIVLGGSLEVMVALELVDAIVELVETGDSLRDNHLVPIADIARSEAVLIARASPTPHPLRARLARRIEGVVIADQYAICEYNLPVAALDAARLVTPGYESPTVQRTEDPAIVAIKVMVKRAELADVMDKLEAIGANAIFATELTNCRL